MTRVMVISLAEPDETLGFELGSADLARFAAGPVTRWILGPGGRWYAQ